VCSHRIQLHFIIFQCSFECILPVGVWNVQCTNCCFLELWLGVKGSQSFPDLGPHLPFLIKLWATGWKENLLKLHNSSLKC
jgi:hypothetical protein